MPIEVRQIWFDTAEVEQAFRLFAQSSGQDVPSGVVGFANENGPDGPITIRTENGTATVERAKLAAALILFCKKSRIPLPAAAKKSVMADGERLILRAALSGLATPSPKPAPTATWARQVTKADL